jgi:hypothetical protein
MAKANDQRSESAIETWFDSDLSVQKLHLESIPSR